MILPSPKLFYAERENLVSILFVAQIEWLFFQPTLLYWTLWSLAFFLKEQKAKKATTTAKIPLRVIPDFAFTTESAFISKSSI